MLITLLLGFPSRTDFCKSVWVTQLHFVECMIDRWFLLLIRAFFNQILELCCFRFYWENWNKEHPQISLTNSPITCSCAITWLPRLLTQPSHLYPESPIPSPLRGMATTIFPFLHLPIPPLCYVIATTTQMCCSIFHLRQLLNRNFLLACTHLFVPLYRYLWLLW